MTEAGTGKRNELWVVACLLLVAGSVLGATPAGPVEIQIVCDESVANLRLRTDLGFCLYVRTPATSILFDAAHDPDILMENLAALGIPLSSITHVVISHHHADHRGGLARLALQSPTFQLWLPRSVPEDLQQLALAGGVHPKLVEEPLELAPGVWVTGPLGDASKEQVLVVHAPSGAIILTGCAHPGLVEIVSRVKQHWGFNEIALLGGGFHLLRVEEAEIVSIIEGLQKLNVKRVMPAHCTGERAKRLFRKAWGFNYVPAGAGRRIVIE